MCLQFLFTILLFKLVVHFHHFISHYSWVSLTQNSQQWLKTPQSFRKPYPEILIIDSFCYLLPPSSNTNSINQVKFWKKLIRKRHTFQSNSFKDDNLLMSTQSTFSKIWQVDYKNWQNFTEVNLSATSLCLGKAKYLIKICMGSSHFLINRTVCHKQTGRYFPNNFQVICLSFTKLYCISYDGSCLWERVPQGNRTLK